LKVSIALNGAGITIPNIPTSDPSSPGTVKGEDGKYYFLNAKSLTKWMKLTFGVAPDNPNHITKSGTEISGSLIDMFGTKKGIYVALFDESDDATGHADIYEGGGCSGGCHETEAEILHLWSLN